MSLIASVQCPQCKGLTWADGQEPVRIVGALHELHHPACPVVKEFTERSALTKVATKASVVGGVLGGAAVGFMVGGPVGAVLGGLLGGALGRNV